MEIGGDKVETGDAVDGWERPEISALVSHNEKRASLHVRVLARTIIGKNFYGNDVGTLRNAANC